MSERPLPEEIAGVLLRDIAAGRWLAGERLPTEHDLVGRFGVSRAVVREAISRLKSDGLVASRRGSGLFVVPPEARSSFRIEPHDLADRDEARAIMELREVVEEAACALAAARRSPEQLARIEATHATFVAAPHPSEAGVTADVAFHVAIAEATGNPYFVQLLSMLSGNVAKVVRNVFTTGPSPRVKKRTVDEHAAMLEAIRQGDAAAATVAVRAHLAGVRKRMGL